MKSIKIGLLATSIVILTGCGGGSGGDYDDGSSDAVDRNITITSSSNVINLGSNKNINAHIDIPNGSKDLYLVLTNSDSTSAKSEIVLPDAKYFGEDIQSKNMQSISDIDNNTIPTRRSIPGLDKAYQEIIATAKNSAVNQSMNFKVKNGANMSTYNDTERFYVLTSNTTGKYIDAFLAKEVRNVETKYGTKTLDIYVNGSDVTQAMVDNLADIFLKEGMDNDIYDWTTNVFGAEWSNSPSREHDYFISSDNHITILLYDISMRGVVGYFNRTNTLTRNSYSNSNEKIMFYIDSVLLARGGTTEKMVHATLAHEFQHMILHHNKGVLKDTETDTWINEMLSEATEDLLASKIKSVGPRGVPYYDGSAGNENNLNTRFGSFNQYNDTGLFTWSNPDTDYPTVSSFGGFLLRNYGGAQVLHDIADSGYSDYRSIEWATGKKIKDLIKEWGIAVMYSDTINPGAGIPVFNTGDFLIDKYGSSTYKIGSADFFTYSISPYFETNLKRYLQPHSNTYYRLKTDASGEIDFSLHLNGNTNATLIVK